MKLKNLEKESQKTLKEREAELGKQIKNLEKLLTSNEKDKHYKKLQDDLRSTIDEKSEQINKFEKIIKDLSEDQTILTEIKNDFAS